ncbi:MAG: DUF1320 domain-containing protein [Bacteroidetes bacterium]|nr:DUF1320 domain-containing protein [Bacteroidota bacterium]
MSAYCTIADVERELGSARLTELSNDEQKATTPNEELVTALIANASDLMDGYLRGRYGLPLAFTSEILRDVCATIVKYRLYRHRQLKISEQVQAEYDEAVSRMKQIQSGKIILGEGITKSEPRQFASNSRTSAFDTSRW